MSVLGEALVVLRGDGKQFPSDIEGSVTGGLQSIVEKGAKILGGLVVAAKLKEQFKEGLTELENTLAVSAQTSAAIEATGGAAGVTEKHVADLAVQMLNLAGVNDEVVAKGANVLLSFTQIANHGTAITDIFDRATKAGLDLATRGFGSIESNARLLGMALSDPEVGITKLRRAGILLTDQQKASIKAFADTGDLLHEQIALLDAIDSKVGGAAEAYGHTLPGRLAIAKESLANLRAELVSGAAPAVELFANASVSAVRAIAGLPDPIKSVIGGIGALAFVATGIVQPLAGISNILSLLQARRAEHAVAAGLETTAVTGAAVAETAEVAVATDSAAVKGLIVVRSFAATAALEAETVANAELATAEEAASVAGLGLGGALVLGAAAAGIGVGVYSALSDTFGNSSKGTDDYTKAIESNTGALVTNVDQVTATALSHDDAAKAARDAGITFESMFSAVRDGTDDWGKLSRSLDTVDTGVTHSASEIKSNLVGALRAGGAESTTFGHSLIIAAENGKLNAQQVGALVRNMQGLHDGYVDGTKAADDHKRKLGEEKVALDAATRSTSLSTDSLQLNETQLKAVVTASDAYRGFVNELTSAMDRSYAASGRMDGATISNKQLISDYEGRVDDLTAALKKNTLTTDLHTDKGRTNYKALTDTGTAIVKLIEGHIKEGATLDEAIKWGDQYVENLRTQLKEAGYTKQQVSDLIDELNLTPDKVHTQFSSNAVEQRIIIEKYVRQLGQIDTRIQTQIEAEINAGDYQRVGQQLDDLAHGRTVTFIPHMQDEYNSYGTITPQMLHDAGVPGYATGGDIPGPLGRAQLAVVHGGERVLSAVENAALASGQPVPAMAGAAARPGDVVQIAVDARGATDPWAVGRATAVEYVETKWRLSRR